MFVVAATVSLVFSIARRVGAVGLGFVGFLGGGLSMAQQVW